MRHDWEHGGAIDRMQAQFPNAPLPWIDLSTGINPWPYRGPGYGADIYDQLPTQRAYLECRDAMANAIQAPPESLILAPGSEAIIRALPHHVSLKRVAILNPTYGDHEQAWSRAGCDVIEVTDPLALADEVDAVIVCNPNNPDGKQFAREALLSARARLNAHGGWLIIDEAYCDLYPELSLAAHGGQDGLIILRSFGKFYGLPGLRLGAALAPEDLCRRLTEQFGAWPVSSAALHIGTKAYRDQAWQTHTRTELRLAREMLDQVFRSNGLEILGGTDLFGFIRVEDATALWRRLAESGLYVRRFDALPHALRIGLPADEIQLVRVNEALSLSA
nr:threonine-phosphate decarboxylase CobD [Hyphomonas sp. Mor2]